MNGMLPGFRFVIGAVLATVVLGVTAFGLASSIRLARQATVGPLESSRSLAFADRADWNQTTDSDITRRFEDIVPKSEAPSAYPPPGSEPRTEPLEIGPADEAPASNPAAAPANDTAAAVADEKPIEAADNKTSAAPDDITGTTEDLMAKFDQEPMFELPASEPSDTTAAEQPAPSVIAAAKPTPASEPPVEQVASIPATAPATEIATVQKKRPRAQLLQGRKPAPQARRIALKPLAKAKVRPRIARLRTVRRAAVRQPTASTGYPVAMPQYTGSIRRY